jgi:hypothetical protein
MEDMDFSNSLYNQWMESSSLPLTALVTIAVVGLIVVGIGAVIWSQRRRLDVRAEMARQMAFQPLADRSELLERVRLLYGRGMERKLRIEFAFWRQLGEATFHWFGLVDEGSGGNDSDTNWVGDHQLLVQSPTLNSPRLSVFSIPKLTGLAGEMAQKVIRMAFNFAIGRSGMVRVEFPEDADFQACFLVSGQHEGAVRAFLDETRRGRLVGMPFPAVHIEAGQDLLWVQPLNMTSGEKLEPTERLRQMIEMTQRVMVILNS